METLIDSRNLRFVFGLIIGIVTIAFVIPVSEIGPAGTDKTAHLLTFAVLGVLLPLAWSSLAWIWAIAALVGYGFAVEIVQGVLPWRSFEWLDFAADAAGALLGLALAALFRPRKSS